MASTAAARAVADPMPWVDDQALVDLLRRGGNPLGSEAWRTTSAWWCARHPDVAAAIQRELSTRLMPALTARFPAAAPRLLRLLAIIFWGEIAAWRIAVRQAETVQRAHDAQAALEEAEEEFGHAYRVGQIFQALGGAPPFLDGFAQHLMRRIMEAGDGRQWHGLFLMETAGVVLYETAAQAATEPAWALLAAYCRPMYADDEKHIRQAQAMLQRNAPAGWVWRSGTNAPLYWQYTVFASWSYWLHRRELIGLGLVPSEGAWSAWQRHHPITPPPAADAAVEHTGGWRARCARHAIRCCYPDEPIPARRIHSAWLRAVTGMAGWSDRFLQSAERRWTHTPAWMEAGIFLLCGGLWAAAAAGCLVTGTDWLAWMKPRRSTNGPLHQI